MKKIIFIGIILLLFGCNVAAMDRPGTPAGTAPQDVADIQRVMETFHHAVATHDGEGVSELFFDQGSTWVTVLSDKAFAASRAKNASAQKVHVSSYRDFSAFVSSTKSDLDPRHTDVRIHSDGAVASVYFISTLSSMAKSKTAATKPGNWSRRWMAGVSLPSRTPRIPGPPEPIKQSSHQVATVRSRRPPDRTGARLNV